MRLKRFARLFLAASAIAINGPAPRAISIASPPVASPVSPRDSLQHIVVPQGLQVELVAHEPDVIDPVAIRFDEDGRMWVVQMRDYPTAGARGNVARSRISVLRDRDGDGFYETATVFADDLHYATGVQPWKGGVFVTMSGVVAYLKDADGDDVADVRETWYTGFAEKNTQLRANHPRLALDNHIYVANGLRGGEIRDARQQRGSHVSISGMDFRFDPFTHSCEAVSGVGQYGLAFDDFGNRFVCSNRNPAIHVVLEDRHVRKNPRFAVPAVSTDVASAGADSRLFPIARAWTTSHLHAGQFTAACGLTIYRGDALPGQYYANLFVCEPTGHLVHREVIEPSGVSFASRPAREGVEFFASRDEWCSPVNLETGPDGALYVVDMYRAVIEHPEWMPKELRERHDLVAGNDRGRIYRIIPVAFGRPAPPRLSAASSESLVELLAHPNAWWRETAARLLLERQDSRPGSRLAHVALQHRSATARVHALWLLEHYGLLHDELLMRLLTDRDPRVLEHAILVAEPRLQVSAPLRKHVSLLITHPDPRVRFQALLAANPLPTPPRHPADRWELAAMLIATGNRGGTALKTMLRDPAALQANVVDPKQFVVELARVAAASSLEQERVVAVESLLDSPAFGRAGLAAMITEVVSEQGSLDALRSKLDGTSRQKLDRALAAAHQDAANTDLPDDIRCEAIDLVACTADAADAILPLALGDSSQAVRLSALEALATTPAVEPWGRLLEQFAYETPAIQRAILDGVLSNAHRTMLLLDAIAAEQIQPQQLDATRTRQLLNHSSPEIKDRAARLFADALPAGREQALADYRIVLAMKADASRGRAVFEKHCAACHRIGGLGVAFAPDISDSREKAPEQLLTDIIQPNRAIDSNFFSYTAVMADGRVHTGVLAAETSTSVTLQQAEGKSVTLRRDQIEELRSDGVSFMPDGMESNIPPQSMADLIAFIKHWRYLAASPP